ncbi:hypothetical protein BH09PSE5_BH09PSE5_21440 [soil metagenome]
MPQAACTQTIRTNMNTTTLRTATFDQPTVVSSSAIASEFPVYEAEAAVGHLAGAGFGMGGTIGAIIGAVAVGVLSMTTDIVLPGSSLYVAGPLSAMLLGAGAGAANGGLVGALVGWGIPVELNADNSVKTDKSIRENVRAVICPNCK